MKELSIEQKSKRYDEAIKKAETLYKVSEPMSGCNVIIETLFPELQESEDEKIRKSLLEYLHTLPNHYAHNGICAPEWIAWLEKQGEQKPAIEMKSAEESLGIDSDTYNKIVDECIYGEQKPAWSEEDCLQLDAAINIVTNSGHTCTSDWLKSIKDRVQPQNTWKPSEEQMDALLFVVQHYTPNVTDKLAWDSIKILELMYYEIKTLKL